MNKLDFQYAVTQLYKLNPTKRGIATELGVSRSTVRGWLSDFQKYNPEYVSKYTLDEILQEINNQYFNQDLEVIEASVNLAKKNQRLNDTNRIERKAFREHARVENAVEDLSHAILEALKEIKVIPPTKPSNVTSSGFVGVLHLSDNHLNEMVNLPHNQFNWEIAAKRLKKFANRAIELFTAYGVNNVVVCFTGDLLNSDRRLDEMLSNATNRASACVLAVYLYGQLLNHLAQYFNVSCAGINGNESRIQKDVGWASEVASDNYDTIVYNMLAMLHGEYINFAKPEHPNEMVINVAGQNLLLIHGHGTKGTGQRNIQSLVGKYVARGVSINMVISGHIHEAFISDLYARSSSLVGSNNYAEDALNLTGRASQNVYLVSKDGGFDGIKVDLQNVGDDSYEIISKLETYNCKMSAPKPTTTVFQVVI